MSFLTFDAQQSALCFLLQLSQHSTPIMDLISCALRLCILLIILIFVFCFFRRRIRRLLDRKAPKSESFTEYFASGLIFVIYPLIYLFICYLSLLLLLLLLLFIFT